MYNGIGLQTVRGSATSGHVQKNMSHVKPEFFRNRVEANTNKNRSSDLNDSRRGRGGKANPEILDHIRKREVEAKLYAARDEFESLGYTEEEIEERLTELKADITRSSSAIVAKAKDSHSIATRKDSENERTKRAFGIVGEFKDGDSFNLEAQEQRRQDRLREKEEKDIAWRKRKEEDAVRREAQKVRRAEQEKERTEARQRQSGRRSRSRSRSGSHENRRRPSYRSRDTAGDRRDRWAMDDGRRDNRSRRRHSRSRSRSSSRSLSRSRDRSRSRSRDRSRSRSHDRSRSRSHDRSRYPASKGNNTRQRAASVSSEKRTVAADVAIDDRLEPNPSSSNIRMDVNIGQQIRPGGRKSRFTSATATAIVAADGIKEKTSGDLDVEVNNRDSSRERKARSPSSSSSSSRSSRSSSSSSSSSSRSRSSSSRSGSSSSRSRSRSPSPVQHDRKRARK